MIKSLSRHGVSAALMSAIAGFCIFFASAGASANPATEAFIQQNFDKGYTILNDSALSEADRRARFRALLLQLAATRRIALFTLGPYGANASPATLDGFVEAFKNYSLSVYERGLSQYDGQTLKVIGSQDRAADDSIVQAEIAGQNGRTAGVAFRVRKNESGAPTITDLLIEGVSLAAAQRDDFIAFLKQHNGNVAELSTRLNMNAGAPATP